MIMADIYYLAGDLEQKIIDELEFWDETGYKAPGGLNFYGYILGIITTYDMLQQFLPSEFKQYIEDRVQDFREDLHRTLNKTLKFQKKR
jgi:hypothetical protein